MALSGCRTAVPAPQAAPTQPTPIPTARTSTPVPEDIAWAKVLESARKEGVVTAYTSNLTGDIGRVTTEAFQKSYGIRLEIVGGIGAVLAERIKTENAAKKFVADTFDTTITGMLPLKDLGMFERLIDLPVLQQKDAWVVNPILDPGEGTVLQRMLTYQAPVINTKLVRPEDEPKSFLDFLDPKWAGKKLVAGQPKVSWPLVFLHTMLPDTIDEKYLRALGKQDLMIVANIRDESAVVGRGEARIAVSTALSYVDPLIREGAPLKALAMKEGAVIPSAGVSALKNAPHPNAARVFINWWLSPEGQTVINRAIGTPSIRKDVPDFSSEATRIKPPKFLVAS